MNGRYLTLAGRIRSELSDIERVVSRTLAIWQEASLSNDDYHVDATALNLHGFYGGVERILEMIADVVDQSKPSGSSWHKELLRQMATEIPRVRPPVLGADLRDTLDKFRGFRHVVRNVYTFKFNPHKVDELVQLLPTAMTQTKQALTEFANYLEEVA